MSERPGAAIDRWREDHRVWVEERLCVACRDEGRCRLGLRLDREGEAVVGTVEFSRHHQGGTGIVHGGFVAAAHDEICGLAVAPRWTVTESIDVSYRRPVPVGPVLEVGSRITEIDGRRLVVEGWIADRSGARLSTARAVYVEIDEGYMRWRAGRVPSEER